ncbi:hypothetical protein [Bacillus toyonensis]|uniref:hypothetical protein n=1 Tax=Bacillus toyonensis TaxID=155322 RepID=UPI002E1E6C52|nr:hypothetical protein [Bacillus toyonensis]
MLKDQEIPISHFAEKPVGICYKCNSDVYRKDKKAICTVCGEITKNDYDTYFYPS